MTQRARLASLWMNTTNVVRTREIEEVEVESVAYVMGDAIGLDTSEYSFSYVARCPSGDIKKVKATGERVGRCACQILEKFRISGHRIVSESCRRAVTTCGA